MRQNLVTNVLARQVVAVAGQAAEAIMAIYAVMCDGQSGREQVALADKADSSPLTRADLAAHECILAGLQALDLGWPVVSEEGADALVPGLRTAPYWLVDPLDGTREFLAMNGQFTVNIALIVEQRPVFGVVTVPVSRCSYWGGEGLGAWRSEPGRRAEPIEVAAWPDAGRPVRVVASKSHMNSATEALIASLGAVSVVSAGSSLKICRIAEGAADIYPRLGPTCEWDTAAADAVLRAAGGHVSQLDGTALMYGKADSVLNPFFIAASRPLQAIPSLRC